ncbi:MAG: hypothetical protein QOH91_1527 [Mycobacterium sp.]|jgi:hypothetical protein|nr:hypothetical protein [Mycobacterium sp.]
MPNTRVLGTGATGKVGGCAARDATQSCWPLALVADRILR